MRGATGFSNKTNHKNTISIHAPRAGRDRAHAVSRRVHCTFQSTRPVRGATERLGVTPPQDWNDVEQVRTAKKAEIGLACSAAIYAGIDVGGAHYSLTEHDQTELMAQFQTVKEGAKEVPYHADGELCRMYTAEEFTALTQAATAHVFYHRTYCNHLNAWIKRAGLDEIPAIVYGADLPADLAASMAALIEKAGGDA